MITPPKTDHGLTPKSNLLEQIFIESFQEVIGELNKYDLNDFQEDALRTAVYPGSGTNAGLIYTILGLCGEAGELANKMKKHLRNCTPVNQEVLQDELSDVLWYVAATAKELGTDLNNLGEYNIKKLTERHKSGTLKDR